MSTSSGALRFLFGVHNHQPLGNFDEVIAEAARLAYRPFFETLARFPRMRAMVHTSGLLLEWWDAHARDLLDLVGELCRRGQLEPLTGGLTEPILPLLPDHDKVDQVRAMTAYVESKLGVRPRGIWLAERVWEPHLARPLAEAGVEYVLVDDHHFGQAGFDPDRLSGYYLTEEQGHTLAVFPISQRLRYLIPFSPVAEVLAALTERVPLGGGLTIVDDGEKFGVWPETHRTVYTEGWLEAFFGALERLPGVEVTTAGDYLDRHPPTGRVYLPTASYREMTEWVLDPAAAAELARVEAEVARVAGPAATRLLRGGFWRNFLVKYPEVNDTYRTMLRLSARVAAGLRERPEDPALLRARRAIWRGQCNDAYWHGVFGGVYLPHLRRALRTALLTAEAELDAQGGEPEAVLHEQGDLDGDGIAEIRIRSRRLALLVRPEAGGTLTELAFRPLAFDLADVLTRRPEASHRRIAEAEAVAAAGGAARSIHNTWRVKEAGLGQLLAYDAHRRASLQDTLFDLGGPGAPAIELAGVPYAAKVRPDGGGVAVDLEAQAETGAGRIAVAKTIRVRPGTDRLEVRYGLRAPGPVGGRLAVRWNLALSGPAGNRYYRTESGERESLEGAGARAGMALTLVDEWLGLSATLSWTPGGQVAWEPVYTVSLSEAGLERIWQGVQVTIVWPVELGRGPWEGLIALELGGPEESA